ncbi:MAG: hypothetical protein JF606_28435 [Burkholderiales bacterium]|nr:hypothetical protein [Burkholderiales bacterium]
MFANVIRTASSSGNLLYALGDMHWWLVHAMPDDRGSAAKAELAVRALAAAQARQRPDPGLVSRRDEIQGRGELGVWQRDDPVGGASRCGDRDRSRQVAGLARQRPKIGGTHQGSGCLAAGEGRL